MISIDNSIILLYNIKMTITQLGMIPMGAPREAWRTEQSDRDLIPHDDLRYALDLAVALNDDVSPTLKRDYFAQQFNDFEQAVQDIPGYQGVFGTGYPFYAEDLSGIHSIAEISRYTKSFYDKIELDRARQLGGIAAWPCAAHQRQQTLPDLKSICGPCDVVDYRPRDLFKVLPDMDFWVVADESNPDIESAVEQKIESAGFYASDGDIGHALRTTIAATEALKRGESPEARLPIDLHIVSKTQLIDAMTQVPAALDVDDNPAEVPISPRSLHVTWEEPDMPYDHAKDFLFSLTPQGWRDTDLITALRDARSETRQVVTRRGGATALVAAMAPKEARQLATPAVARLLVERVESWV